MKSLQSTSRTTEKEVNQMTRFNASAVPVNYLKYEHESAPRGLITSEAAG